MISTMERRRKQSVALFWVRCFFLHVFFYGNDFRPNVRSFINIGEVLVVTKIVWSSAASTKTILGDLITNNFILPRTLLLATLGLSTLYIYRFCFTYGE